MRLANPENYSLEGFEVNRGQKKYDAILKNKKTGEMKRVPFGQKGFQHYKDKIGHYSDLDHNDEKRRKNWLSRHKANYGFKFSSAWFAKTYLW